jgi:tetratricopeptide (TPR) repeat protein
MRTLIFLLLLLQSPDDTYKSANEDLQAGRWAEAVSKYELVLKDDPSHIPSRFNLALCYSKLGNVVNAIAGYRQVLEQDPTIYEARTNLAVLLDDEGRRPEAGAEFEKALSLHPDDPQAKLNLGMFYMRGTELEKAHPYLTAAANAGLNSPELYVALSEVERGRRNETKSREYLEKASELDPANRNVRRQLGIIYREAGEYEKAIGALRPLLPDSRLELALSYFDNKNYAEAIPLLVELADANAENVDYWYLLGRSYAEVKAYPQAVAVLQQVLRLKSDHVEAYGTLGSVYYSIEDWARAAEALTRFLELKPGQAFAHFVLATCFDKLGRPKDAAVHYNKFLEYDDGSNDARSFQARQRAKTLERRLKK